MMDHFLGRNDEQIQCRGILHIVEYGDTLYKIGKKHGVPVSRIMYANPYVDVYNLQVGDEICVPVMSPRMQNEEHGAPNQTAPQQAAPMRENQMGADARERDTEQADAGEPMRENRMGMDAWERYTEQVDVSEPMQENRMEEEHRMPQEQETDQEHAKALPWNDTVVTERMMEQYLQTVPE